MAKRKSALSLAEPAAGDGILSRRILFDGAIAAAASSMTTYNAAAEPLIVQSYMHSPGAGFSPYGQPSRFEDKMVRVIPPPPAPGLLGIGTAPDAAAFAGRNDHAVEAAFRAQPLGNTGHRS